MTIPNRNGGGSAFPTEYDNGINKRDWFAAQALNGLISASPPGHMIANEYAKTAYQFADAMLKEKG